MWWASLNQLKAGIEEKADLLQARGNSVIRQPLDMNYSISFSGSLAYRPFGMEMQHQHCWLSSLLVYPADFRLASLHNHLRQLIKISVY